MNAQAGRIIIQIEETGGAVLLCDGCGELRREPDPHRVAMRVGALAKAHAGLHATSAAKGFSFGFLAALRGTDR